MLCFGGFKVVESSFMIDGSIMWCFIQFNLFFMSYLEKMNLIVKCLHFKFDFMVLLFLVFGFIKCCYPISAADLLMKFSPGEAGPVPTMEIEEGSFRMVKLYEDRGEKEKKGERKDSVSTYPK